MNLALHGILLQVILSIIDLKYGGLCSAGEPGYLDFDNLPETNFSCQGKVIGGYYADVEAGCQMFHVCTIGQKDEIMDIKFLCLNGTVFDQETRVCERVDEVDCSKSERFYNLNLELYGNNAVTLSLHEEDDDDDNNNANDDNNNRNINNNNNNNHNNNNNNNDDDDDNDDGDDGSLNDHHQETSARPTTTSPSPTTSPRPLISSTTISGGVSYQNGNGYPQHYQPQQPFPPVQTSQSNSEYDDKNGGYHRQYIYHTGDQHNGNHDNDDNQATSYQLFSNQGASSTTGSPQHHQISTGTSHYHATSTIQTLLNSNNPKNINSLYHNHGIASTTEHTYTLHNNNINNNNNNNNPRDTSDYHQSSSQGSTQELSKNNRMNVERRHLEPVQATSQGKISKLIISPIPEQNNQNNNQMKQKKIDTNIQQQQQQQQQHHVSGTFVTIPPSNGGSGVTVRTFYPTPKTSTSQTITQHIHLPPPPSIPQLKPHQVTINLPPPEIQRIVQNPSPLLPTQSRVIVTAKASVSDESGRPLNTTQLVTLPLPTIPSSYDDYKEGDESFDPFYRDVPKIRNSRRSQIDYRWSPIKFRIYPRYTRKKRSTVEIVQSRILDNNNNNNNNAAYINAHLSGGEGISDDYIIPETMSSETDYTSQELPDKMTSFNNYSDEIYDDDHHNQHQENNSKHFNDDRDSNEVGNTEKPLENSNESYEDIDYDSEEYSTLNEVTTTDNTKQVDEIETEFPTDIPTTTRHFESTTTVTKIESNSVNKNEEDTNGILKFTDEIPKLKDKNNSMDSDENLPFPRVPQDYVDDNFESYSYEKNVKPIEALINKTDNTNLMNYSSTESIEGMNLNGNSIPLLNTMVSTTSTTTTAPTSTTTNAPSSTTTAVTTSTSTTTTTTMSAPIVTLPTSITTLLMSTTTAPSTTIPTTQSPSTIISTTQSTSTTIPTTQSTSTNVPTTQSTSTTLSPTTIRTTTIRQKVYKAFTTRKSYNYIPPPTLQTPVVIKSRPSLLNPKPAKPLRSYNDGAPKPIIKKLPLSAKRDWKTTIDHPNEITSTTEFLPKLPLEQILEAERMVMNQITSNTNVNPNKLNVEIEISISTTTSSKPEKFYNESFIKNSTSNNFTDETLPKLPTGDSDKINEHHDMKVKDEYKYDNNDPTKTDLITENINLETPASNVASSTLASVHVSKRPGGYYKRIPGFNCIDKKMYYFYADDRDCRLFHYCSPGFTTKQILDFRFVCEEGTVFDQQTQSCLHQLDNPICQKRLW